MTNLWVDPQVGIGLEVQGFVLEAPMQRSSPGTLYLATGEHSSAPRVIRLIRVQHRLNAEGSFGRLRQVHHPNLASYEGVGIIDDGPLRGNWWLARRDLRRRFSHPAGLLRQRSSAVSKMMIDLAEGLSHLHRNGIVHGDVKPSNVAVTEGGDFQLLDFGLAPALLEHLTVTEAHRRRFYLSPEFSEVGASELGDVYGWAATVLTIMAGERRFEHPLSLLDDLAQDQSISSWDLLRSCLLPEPEARPQLSAVLAYLRADVDEVDRLFSATMREVVTSTRFRASLAALAAGSSLSPEDLAQDSAERILRRAREDVSLSVRLTGRAAMARYLTTVARNLMKDFFRRNVQSLPVADLSGLVDKAHMDPLEAGEGAKDALDAVSAEVGGPLARLLWRRVYGGSYAEIAAELEWTERRTFMAVYRLRRAYPELSDVLPPEDVDYAEMRIAEWLTDLGVDEGLKRSTLAAALAGRALTEIAAREGVSPSSVQKRLSRMARDNRMVALLLQGMAVDSDKLRRTAPFINDNPEITYPSDLLQPWQVSVREQAIGLIDAVLTGDWEPDEKQLRPEEAVELILQDVDLALEAQRALLDHPMTELPSPTSARVGELLASIEAAVARSELIVLRTERGDLAPSFQWVTDGEAEGRIDPTVARVNRHLDAGDDPVGALAWWTQSNARIGGRRPLDLLVAGEIGTLLALGEASHPDAA